MGHRQGGEKEEGANSDSEAPKGATRQGTNRSDGERGTRKRSKVPKH